MLTPSFGFKDLSRALANKRSAKRDDSSSSSSGSCYIIACASGANAACGLTSTKYTLCTDSSYPYCGIDTVNPDDFSASGKCVAAGSIANGGYCDEPEPCKSGYCDDDSHKCADKVDNGQPCSDDEQCKSDKCDTSAETRTCVDKQANGATCTFGDDCTSGICVGKILNGKIVYNCSDSQYTVNQACYGYDDCVDDLRCDYNYNSTYGGFVGVCVNPTGGKNDGDACLGDSECRSHSCINKKCVGAQLGAACDFSNSNCTGTLSCAPTSAATSKNTVGTCIKSFSLAAGSLCADFQHCNEGLGCTSNDDETIGKCVAQSASSNKICSEDSDCDGTKGETCDCNYNDGKNECKQSISIVPKGAADLQQKFYDCAIAAKCADGGFNCTIARCQSLTCQVLDIYINALLPTFSAEYPQCYANYAQNEYAAFKVSLGCNQKFTVTQVSLTVAGTCASTKDTVTASLNQKFSAKGDISCSDSSKRDAKATYTVNLNDAISQSAADAAISSVSTDLKASGITVTGSNKQTTNSDASIVSQSVLFISSIVLVALLF